MARTKGARNLSADMVLRKSFLRVFRKAGGEAWLLEQAKAAPIEFLKAMIAVTKPPPQAKATEPEPPPQELATLSPFEQARHVAFALASALHATGQPLTIEGEVIVDQPADWQPPAWRPPQDQEPVAATEQQSEDAEAVEQPALPAPEPAPEPQAKPERRSLADLLGYEPPPAIAPSLYGGVGQYRSGDPAEQGTQRRDLIGDVRVVQRAESVAAKYRRMKGG